MIEVSCSCGKKLHAKPEHAGKRAKCPGCGKAVTVPNPDDDLRIIEEEPVVTSAAARTPASVCKQHPTKRAVGKCAICGDPLCSECRALLGYYYCSPEHKAQSKEWSPDPSVGPVGTTAEERQAEARSVLQFKIIKFAVLGLVAVIVLYFVAGWIFNKGGSVAWEADLNGEIPLMILPKGNEVSVLTQGGKIQAFDTGGDPTPERDLGIDSGRSDFGGIVRGTAILSDGSKTSGVSLDNGKVLWTYPAGVRFGWGSELVHDGGLIFLPLREKIEKPEEEKKPANTKLKAFRAMLEERGISLNFGPRTHVAAVDAGTGKEVWKFALDNPSYSLNLTGGYGHLLVRTAEPSGKDGQTVVVTIRSASDGRALWKLSSTEARILSEPLPVSGGLLIVTETGLKCLKYADGSPAWSLPLDLKAGKKSQRIMGRTFHYTEERMKNLWLIDGALYLNVGSDLKRLDPSSGKEIWSKRQNAIISDLMAAGSILVADGATEKDVAAQIEKDPFIAGGDQLATVLREEMGGGVTYVPITLAINPGNGETLWASRLSGKMIPTPHGLVVVKTLVRPNLFARIGGPITNTQGMLRLLDPGDGETVWEYVVDGDISHPVVVGRQIVFGMTFGTSFDPDAEGYVMKAKESKIISVWIK